MTAIPPTIPDPQTDRPSSAVVLVGHTETLINTIVAKLCGVLLFGGGAYLAYLEAIKPEPRTAQLALVVGVSVLGLGMAATDPLVNTIRSVGAALSPYLGKFGGKA